MTKIYLIAGEASGDNIAAKLMRCLKEIDPKIEFYGIGGEKMQAVGMNLLFPASELSLIGFWEILPHIPKLWWKIRQTISDIKKIDPDLVITVDSPGFSFRVAKKLKDKISAKLVHYVAPTVWAYKPGRAKKIAKIYDHLLTILPFETEYFLKEGLETSFVGFPALEDLPPSSKELFRFKHDIAKGELLLCLAPGSREQEVKTLLPIFLNAARLFIKRSELKVTIAIPCQANLRDLIVKLLPTDLSIILLSETEKLSLFAAADLALTKSGTITTELAFYGVPMVVAYKVNQISYWLIKMMIKVKFVTIINILANKAIIPEMLQAKCNAKDLSEELIKLTAIKVRKKQLNQISDNLAKLQINSESASSVAARKIFALIGNKG